MMLHLIFQAVVDEALVARIDPGDTVVFLENAVLRTLKNGRAHKLLSPLLVNNRVYVISDQLEVRGINTSELVPGVTVIDYVGFVELTVMCPVIQSWN